LVSVAGAGFGSAERRAAVLAARLDVVRAGGFGLGSGSVVLGSSVFGVSTGVSSGFGAGVVVVVRRGVRDVGGRLRAVRGAGLAGAVSAGVGVSVTAGFGDSTGVGAGVGSGSAGTTATSLSGGGGSSMRAPTDDARLPGRPVATVEDAPGVSVSAIPVPSIA